MHIFDPEGIFLVLKNMTKGNLTGCLHFIHFQSDSREKINSYFVKFINVDMLGKKVTYTFAKLSISLLTKFKKKRGETNDIV